MEKERERDRKRRAERQEYLQVLHQYTLMGKQTTSLSSLCKDVSCVRKKNVPTLNADIATDVGRTLQAGILP